MKLLLLLALTPPISQASECTNLAKKSGYTYQAKLSCHHAASSNKKVKACLDSKNISHDEFIKYAMVGRNIFLINKNKGGIELACKKSKLTTHF